MSTHTRPRWQALSCWDLSIGPAIHGRLPEIADVRVIPPSPDQIKAHLGQAQVYLATLAVRLDEELLEHASALRLVVTPSTGLDHLDLPALEKRGIRVVSLKEEIDFLNNVTATAEMAWALLLSLVRRVPWGFDAACQGRWARDEFRGHQLSGKTLGILGVGRLGRIVAQYGQAFRMRVLGCDRKPLQIPGVQIVNLDTLLRESDVLSIHIHLTPENRHFVGASEFAKMKPGAVLINTSRGAIVDESAMLIALISGQIAGAGLDVIEGEWRSDLIEHPVIRYARTHQNVVISPHTGGITFESQQMAFEFIANRGVEALQRMNP
jgi:D-3-phosphoglycerate dehydrogenase / 2-oxoglutarate reductase